MLLIPAIDLKDGKCVRLRQGIKEKSTIYSQDPLAQALHFEKLGSSMIHLVNLDGAFGIKSKNIEIIKEIITQLNIPIQIGGGIRDLSAIEMWIDHGASRVILGTVAVKNPKIVAEACKKFSNKIVAGIDVREGFVAVEGWEKRTFIKGLSLAKQLITLGISRIIYTEIENDGMQKGMNIESIANFAKSVDANIIASGGFSSLQDFEDLKSTGCKNIEGIIVGKAIYDGTFDLAAILKK